MAARRLRPAGDRQPLGLARATLAPPDRAPVKPIHAILAALVLTAAVVVWVQPWAVRDRDAGVPPKGVGATQPPADADYDLTTPSASFELPDELAEISALTDINDHTVACVQDEVGVVFWVDVRSGAVVRQLPFGDDGDYEGLARVGDALWVLRSDGLMVELVVRDGAFEIARQVQLDLDHRELEGLGYDPVERVVLVAPKSPAKAASRSARDGRCSGSTPSPARCSMGSRSTRPSSASSPTRSARGSRCRRA